MEVYVVYVVITSNNSEDDGECVEAGEQEVVNNPKELIGYSNKSHCRRELR